MCSDPQKNDDGQEFACGNCNECVSGEKFDWTARVVAETNTQRWGGVVSLTYDGSEASKNGTLSYRYSDIQEWIQRLRNKTCGDVRYLVAGERGSRRDRVHWHVIIWGAENLFALGQWADFHAQYNGGYLPSHGPQKPYLVEHTHEKRLVWSEWPFGHVYTDVVTTETANYVLKYAYKERFNAKRSKGTAREGKGEVHSSSFFRMSKKPPIGETYILTEIARLAAKKAVNPLMRITIPGHAYWWKPKYKNGETYREGLGIIYNHCMEKTGKPPAGWLAMMSNLARTDIGVKHMEHIGETINGTAQEKAELWFNTRKRPYTPTKPEYCNRVFPCSACLQAVLHKTSWVSNKQILQATIAAAEERYRRAKNTGYTPSVLDAEESEIDAYRIETQGRNLSCLFPRASEKPAGEITEYKEGKRLFGE
jgi:hypothetical protein